MRICEEQRRIVPLDPAGLPPVRAPPFLYVQRYIPGPKVAPDNVMMRIPPRPRPPVVA